jgi:hypothetical protein
MVIVGVVAFVILAAIVALIKMRPHAGAGAAEKKQARNTAVAHREEPRAPGLD